MSGDEGRRTTGAKAPPSYVGERLDRFLAKVAERSPAPGGGSVAAVAVSLAAALVEMGARYSADEVTDALAVAGTAHRIRIRAGELADADARAYRAVIAASAAASAADEPGAHQADLRAALHQASQVPVETARLGAEAAQLAARLVAEGNPKLRGDCATAALLAEAATRAAAHLVDLNAEAAGGDDLLVWQARRSLDIAHAAASNVT